MATIHVDGTTHEADARQNLLHACLSRALDLPYFCWHPALGSVGACRQCAVKLFRDEADTKGRIVMACMTPVTDGARLSIDDPEAKAFRGAVVEGLMLNHPHDCPVCDEGGECHLQDMTVMTGHRCRTYSFPKRTFANQDLGPFLNHEMNRCIQCYRCVRYYREYAGGHDLNAFRLRDIVYFGRHEDGPLENEFSGNLVEICPTGVFTDATLKHHAARKWDLQMAPSVCVHCGVGCNTTVGERYGTLRRVVNRFNHEVNGYFLCDRGRFGYEFVNGEQRVNTPLLRGQAVEKDAAVAHLAGLLNSGGVVGIGSPRASLEANFALRTMVGPEQFHSGLSDDEHQLVSLMVRTLRHSPARSPSLHEVEQADAVLVLGEDVTNTAPRLALSLRQSVRNQPMRIADRLNIPRWLDHAVREAVQDEKGPLFIAAPSATPLDDVAAVWYHAAPDDLARLGFAVAHEIDHAATPVPGLEAGLRALAERIAAALRTAERPLVVSGAGCGSEAVIQAAASVALALCRMGRPAALSFAMAECNTFGLALMGAQPLAGAWDTLRDGRADTLVVLENDLYRRGHAGWVTGLLAAARHVVVIDHSQHRTTERAELLLPASTFAESDGTLVNQEGRAQRFFEAYLASSGIQESWRWLRDAMAAVRPEAASWRVLDDVLAAMAAEMPDLAPAADAAPHVTASRVAREPHRYSGRTAMLAHISVHEPKPPDDPDAPLSFSMEGGLTKADPALLPFFWSPGWNSIQAVNKFQDEVGGARRGGDPGVRLVEPAAAGEHTGVVPAAFRPRADEWLLVPLHHIYGSEEMSRRAPAVAARAPQPYVALHPEEAARLRVAPGEEVEVSANGLVFAVPVTLRPDLPRGVAGLPVGLPPFEGLSLPCWSGLSPRETTSAGSAPRALAAEGQR